MGFPEIFITKFELDDWQKTDKWVEAGKPIVWVEEFNREGIQIHGDMGYGRIRVSYHEKVKTGDSMVYIDDIVGDCWWERRDFDWVD